MKCPTRCRAVSLVLAATLLAGCASATGRRPDDALTATCGPPTTQTDLIPAPPRSLSSNYRQPATAPSENVPARADAVALDGTQPSYRPYLKAIRDRIRANWIYPREAGEKNVVGNPVIDFYIAKDGRLEHAQVTRSSGTKILDDYALVAVKLAQPFPPVPDTLCMQTLGVTGTFRYELKRGK